MLQPHPSRRCSHFPNLLRDVVQPLTPGAEVTLPRVPSVSPCQTPDPSGDVARAPTLLGEPTLCQAPKCPGFPPPPQVPAGPGVRDLALALCCHGPYPPIPKNELADPCARRHVHRHSKERSNAKAGKHRTSPAQPVPFAPSLLLQCRKNQTPVRHPPRPGATATQSRATLSVLLPSQKGVPGREMAWHRSVHLAGPQATAAGRYCQPPGRNIEKTGAYKRVTRGRARAKHTITAQESGSVPSPCAHGTRKGDLAAKSRARGTRCRGSQASLSPLPGCWAPAALGSLSLAAPCSREAQP